MALVAHPNPPHTPHTIHTHTHTHRRCVVSWVSLYLMSLSQSTLYSESTHTPHTHTHTHTQLSPPTHRHMTDTPVSEREFIENLHELDHKIKFLNLQVKIHPSHPSQTTHPHRTSMTAEPRLMWETLWINWRWRPSQRSESTCCTRSTSSESPWPIITWLRTSCSITSTHYCTLGKGVV